MKMRYDGIEVELIRLDNISYYDHNYYKVKETIGAEFATFSEDLVIYEQFSEMFNSYSYDFGYMGSKGFSSLFCLDGYLDGEWVKAGCFEFSF